MHRAKLPSHAVILLAALSCSLAWGASGTSKIASKSEKVHPMPHWPEGLGQLLNDAARTEGWCSWFTEWPNDDHAV
jgi:hypothetical protein